MIQIDDNYRIVPERQGGWIIQEYKMISKKTQEWKWVGVCYPSNLSQAIKKIAHLKLCDADCQTLAQALVEIDRIATKLQIALEPALRVDLDRLR